MKNSTHTLSLILLAAASLPLAAQQSMTLPDAQTNATALPSRPVEAEATTDTAAAEPKLSEAEQRIRVGIIMLARLHELMSGIKDEATAEAAVAPIMRASSEFLSWAQGFASLPPLDADTQRRYEQRYLPVIDELNTRIKIQGERLASAEFYGSKNLPAALVRLVTSMQQ